MLTANIPINMTKCDSLEASLERAGVFFIFSLFFECLTIWALFPLDHLISADHK